MSKQAKVPAKQAIHPFATMQDDDNNGDDSSDEEIPSPPPFYRVCGHFTVLNPSRPMALAKLLEQAALADTEIANTSPASTEVSMLDIPDLVGDYLTSPTDNDWPVLERMRALSVDFSGSNDEEEKKVATSTELAKTQDDHFSSVSSPFSHQVPLSSIGMIPTPEGLARLLKNDDTSQQQQQSQCQASDVTHPRRHVRWTTEEDELLRAAVELEEGPPHNWKRISKKYFRGTRNAMACKGRWNKVRELFMVKFGLLRVLSRRYQPSMLELFAEFTAWHRP